MDDIAVLGINVSLGVEALDEVVAQLLGDGGAHAGHDAHVQHHVDGVGQLDAVLGEGGAHNTHGVGDYIHGAALHGAGVQLEELLIHLLGVHPVIGGAGVLLAAAANEGAVLHAGHVVDGGAVQVAVGQLLLVELLDLAGGAGLGPQLLDLLVGAVDPDDLVGLGHLGHFINPIENGLIAGQGLGMIHDEFPPMNWYISESQCFLTSMILKSSRNCKRYPKKTDEFSVNFFYYFGGHGLQFPQGL